MRMKSRMLAIILFALGSCATGFGQSSFKGLIPGQSTKADVERALGRPVREVSETLAEYRSDREAEKVFVQYGENSSVVERIEAVYPNTIERAAVIRSLNLPARPTASQSNASGRLEEYFATAKIVLTYGSADAGGGVIRVGYYSRELFDRAPAKVPRSPQNPGRIAAADSSGPERSRPPESASRAGRPSTPSAGESTSTESEGTPATATRPAPSIDPSPGISFVLRIPDEVREGSGAVESVTPGGDDREAPLSEAERKRFVGRWEFTSSTNDSLKEADVALAGGRLTFKIGLSAHALVHTGKSKITVSDQGQSEKHSEQFNFKITGMPDAIIRFTVADGEVLEMFYAEQKAGEMTFATAFRKPD